MTATAGTGADLRRRRHPGRPRRGGRAAIAHYAEFAVSSRADPRPHVRRARVALHGGDVPTVGRARRSAAVRARRVHDRGAVGRRARRRLPRLQRRRRPRRSSGCSTARSSRCARSSPVRSTWPLDGRSTRLTAADFPRVLWPVLVADVAHCVANAVLVAVVVVAQREGAASARSLIGDDAQVRGVVPRLRPLRAADRGAVGRRRIGPLAALLLAAAAARRALGVRQFAAEREAYQAHDPRAGPGGRDQGRATPAATASGSRAPSVMIARVIGDARGPGQRAAVRGHRCTTSASSASRPSVLQKAGGLTDDEFAAIKLHPVRGLEIVSDIEFLDEAFEGILPPPRAHRRPRLPDGPARARRSRSSPASSRSPTRSTR